jgi:hypothetical protein
MMVREEEQRVKTRCGREAKGIKIGSEAQSKAGKKERKKASGDGECWADVRSSFPPGELFK